MRGSQQMSGPVEHIILIRNRGNAAYWIPLQPSSQMNWLIPDAAPLKQMWVVKGAGGPSKEGVHHALIDDHFHCTGTSSTYARPRSDP